MPLGAGQNIGTAFVRVVVDGKDFDLSELFDETEGEMGKAGKRGSKAYQEAWREEWESGPNKRAFDDAIRRMLVSGDTAKAMVNSTEFQRFRANLEKEFGDVGRRAGENLTEEMNRGLDVSQLEGRIANMRRDLARAQDELYREALQNEQDQFRLHLDTIAAYRERDLRNQQQVAMVAAALREDEYRDLQRTIMLDQAYRMNKEFDIRKEIELQNELAFLTRAFRINEEMDTKAVIKANSDLQATYSRLRVEVEAMEKGYRRSSLTATDLREELDKVAASMEKAKIMTDQMRHDIDRHRNSLLVLNPELNLWRHRLNGAADGIGRAFGKGARNDFVNFMGVVVGGIARLPGVFIGLASYLNGFKNRVMDASGWLGGIGVVGREAAKGLGVLGVGMVGLFGIIGPLISLLSGLGGMVLAVASSMGAALLGAISSLSSTLVFGLAGAVGVAALSFAPLVAGIGVFALAVKNADADTKAAFKSIGKEFSGLGKVAADATFGNIAEQATRFKGVIGDLSPLVRGVGKALSNVADGWLDLMEGPGFAKFQQAMTEFLPGAVEQLGAAVGNVAAGIGGLFRALIPQTEVFLDWLVDITARFRDFANSANGQTSLRNFFADAASSAATLGSFIAAVGSLLGEVFEQANAPGDNLFRSMTQGLLDWADALDRNPDIMGGWIDSMKSFGEFVGSARNLLIELVSAGREVGDSLFGSMSDQIDRWVTTLRSNPDILRNWYNSAADFARVLGDVVIGLGKVFDALDNTFSRSFLTGTFEVIATLIEGFASALEGVASLFGDSASAVENFAGKVAAAAFVLPLLTKAMGVGAITTFVANMKDAEKRMTALAGAARFAAGAGGLLAFQQGASSSNDAAGILMQTLGGAGLGFSIGGPWGALIGGAAGAAMGLFSRKTKEAAGAAADAGPDFSSLADTLDDVTGAANRATREMVLQEAQTSGVAAQARGLGISMRDLVSASLGNEGAMRRVTAAMNDGKTTTVTYRDALGGIISMNVGSKKEADRLTESLRAQGLEILDVERKALDLAASNAIKKFVGESVNEWKQSTKQVRENYLATQDLSGLLGKLPKKKAIKIDAEGVAPTIQGVAKVAAKYDLLPKQVRTLLEVMGVDLSVKDILRMQRELDNTDKRKPKPKVDVDPSFFDKGMKDVNSALEAVGKVTKTPKVTVNTGSSVSDTNAVKNAIEALRDRTVTITTNYKVTGNVTDAVAPKTAVGGIFTNAQTRLIGEAGPEAVVPLARNLSMVDPSVRWLSAIAQGKSDCLATPTGKSVSADNWTIVSQSRDPETVAAEVFNRLVGAGY
jgi:hypothetical protein